MKRLTGMFFIMIIAAALPLSGNENQGEMLRLKSGKGAEKEIIVSWDSQDDIDEYIVYRSTASGGPYNEIGRTTKNTFNDKDAVPGIKYWYRVSTVTDEAEGPLSDPDYGYIRIPEIKGESMARLMRKKKRRLPAIKSRKEKKIINFLKKYYTNEIKLSIIVFVGRRYVEKGELTLLTDFDDYRFDYKKRTVFLIRKGKYVVRFYSNRLFTILKEAKKLDPARDRISKRLLDNAVAYCIYTGLKEYTMNDGITYFLHSYEAVGISTEYFKNVRKWRTNTIMLGSSNKKIKEMMKEAQRKSMKDED